MWFHWFIYNWTKLVSKPTTKIFLFSISTVENFKLSRCKYYRFSVTTQWIRGPVNSYFFLIISDVCITETRQRRLTAVSLKIEILTGIFHLSWISIKRKPQIFKIVFFQFIYAISTESPRQFAFERISLLKISKYKYKCIKYVD